MVYLVICKNEDPPKNDCTRVVTIIRMVTGHKIFSIITLWELSAAMETKVLIRSGPKPNTDNPPPSDAPDEI